MWQQLYSCLFLPLFRAGVAALSLVNEKVRRGIRGRREIFRTVEAFDRAHPSVRRVWIHVSSMGEFEQSKPIVEAVTRTFRNVSVVVTFFSPSGYENSRRYPHADCITYIPFDSRANARRFLDLLRPSIALFIRYDIWPNHVWECSRRGIPVVLANATMRDRSARLLPGARAFHRAVFGRFTAILTISDRDRENFRRFGIDERMLAVSGDTRYDRVDGKAREAKNVTLLPPSAVENRRVLVAGSSWTEDEDVLIPVVFALLRHQPGLLCVIVPHEPTIEHLESLEFRLSERVRSIRFSHMQQYAGQQVVLVDSIGILLPLYASAHVAFVGGGFRSNVHNTLEPAAYGIPVVYGPKVQNSQEAVQLRDAGGGFIVRDKRETYRILRGLLGDDALRTRVGGRAGAFVRSRCGATDRIIRHLSGLLPPSAG